MTRLKTLKQEKEQIINMDCLAFSIKEAAVKYYDHEIECIEQWGSPNPEYKDKSIGWIPVSERLPGIRNHIEKYLVTNKDGEVRTAFFTETDGKHWWSFDSFNDVIAWMPLPDPYTENQGENK